ncbi:hypothetical protein NGB36_20360 [Streptomyces sp. RB6PN25]|uniref:Terpene synthase n=1 Tax=Streptomyces humicola TaxID=2953240 RepID=A0ABT1PYY5_9ACTN|nr:hypothetical protein [Streptomyces humicola]MCQ4082890.1 hypothetical protein [Streptomyces humicola]
MTEVADRIPAPPLKAVPFYCPIAPAVHPLVDDIDAAAVRWMMRQELDSDPRQLHRLTLCDFGGLTAKTMPYGLPRALTAMAKFHSVLFSLDDSQCDEVPVTPADLSRTTANILRAVEGAGDAGSDGDSPHAAAMRKLRTEMEEHASPNQLRRWAEAMRTYAHGLVWEAEYRTASGLPALNDYVAMWMRAIGMAPSTALIDVMAGYEVPDRDLERPAVRALTEMTWTLVSWDNDFYSRNKEISRAGDDLNLIDVLAHERGCDPAEALEEAVTLRDRVMVHFLRLRQQVVAGGAGSELRRYVHGLGQFIRGHLDWASHCARYTAPSVAPVAAPASPADWWKGLPADVSREPLPIPAIAWWWGTLDA